jgi:excisionase family DNA binding protein
MDPLELAMTATDSTKMTLPVEKEMQAAVQGQRALAAFLATRFETQHIQIFDDKNQAHQVELPTSALRLLVDILAELADGNAVKVVPVHAELTTQEAADMLNVSRPHLVKLLEKGELPFHKTGKHRRVRFTDLMQFKTRRDQASEDAMAELAKQAQELSPGYD